MTPRVGVISNRRAGRNEARIEQVLRELDRHADVLHRETSSHERVPEALGEFAEAGVALLVVNGGDGTLQHTLTSILGSEQRRWVPMVAPLRSGRTNMAALDLDADADPVRGLRGLLEDARADRLEARLRERRVLRMDGGPGPQFGMFFGAGMLYRAIQLTHRRFPDGRAQGVFGAGLVTAALIARSAAGQRTGVLDPDKLQISLDGEPLVPEEFVLVLATSLERLFLRLRPYWGSGPGPVHFTAIASGAERLARAVPGICRGRPPAHVTPEHGYTSRNVQEAAFHLDCGLTLDGELYPPEPGRVVTLRADDRLRFVRA